MLPTPDDHVAITQLLARYCLLLDHDDIDAWVGLFTPGAVYEVYGREFVGRDGLRKLMTGAPGGLHLGGPPVIRMVDADRAVAQQNLLFAEALEGIMRSALYDDELVRTPDGWRIARRRCRFITPDGITDRPVR